MMKNITVSKLDAAKRQLETVIRLYFFDGDPVSIHTLTSAVLGSSLGVRSCNHTLSQCKTRPYQLSTTPLL